MKMLALTLCLLFSQQAPAKPAATIAGKWNVALEMASGTASPTLELTQDGEKVGGFYQGRYGKFALKGTLEARALDFSFQMDVEGTDVTMKFRGEVAADFQSMKGVAEIADSEVPWTAKRAEKRP
jgi:hypothetical protein